MEPRNPGKIHQPRNLVATLNPGMPCLGRKPAPVVDTSGRIKALATEALSAKKALTTTGATIVETPTAWKVQNLGTPFPHQKIDPSKGTF